MFQATDSHLVGFYIVVYLVWSNILVESTVSIFRVAHFASGGCRIIGRRRVQDLH
jgi:hypothetical protein